ncbi:hypothetical protein [Methylobacterium sp. Leaf466]|uniref:hypothetical protein n=1 Tax=Methylobacterium sp. Leaf466 TaxID=1736386 RepID=UPI0006F5B052|nr:hypothetical protein [Methylobacterium sp. Leaf466]KQT77959.1 hypothetical protein ASG59_11665 [Methylobacterium sp. Leaf466]
MVDDARTPGKGQPPGPHEDDTKPTSGAKTAPSDKGSPENDQGALNERLDEALEETFPSSDPVSVKITK